MTPKEIIEKAVWNPTLRRAILNQPAANGDNPDFYEVCQKFMNFQRSECENKKPKFDFDKEGFQICEPWDGDIERAPVLFLSPHPDFHRDEVCPRYHAQNDTLEMDGKSLTLNDLIGFLCEHIQQYVPGENPKSETLEIPLFGRDGGEKRGAVDYWGSVRNHMEALLPPNVHAQYMDKVKAKQLTEKQYARLLMKDAVLVPLVPFRVDTENDNDMKEAVKAAADVCWNEFTKHTLVNSGASVFVLVGEDVLNTFAKHIFDDGTREAIKKDLKNSGIHSYTDNDGHKRLVVWLKGNQGTFSGFNDDGRTGGAFGEIKAALANVLIYHN